MDKRRRVKLLELLLALNEGAVKRLCVGQYQKWYPVISPQGAATEMKLASKSPPSSPSQRRLATENRQSEKKEEWLYCFYLPWPLMKKNGVDFHLAKLGYSADIDNRFNTFRDIWGKDLKISREGDSEHIIFLLRGTGLKQYENSLRAELKRQGGCLVPTELVKAFATSKKWTRNHVNHGFSEFVLIPKTSIDKLRQVFIAHKDKLLKLWRSLSVNGQEHSLYTFKWDDWDDIDSDEETSGESEV